MSYLTAQELRNRTNLASTSTGDKTNDSQLDIFIADASAEVNSYLSGYYVLSSLANSQLIKQLTADIASKRLVSVINNAFDEVTEQDILNNYDKAIDKLLAIQHDEIELNDATKINTSFYVSKYEDKTDKW